MEGGNFISQDNIPAWTWTNQGQTFFVSPSAPKNKFWLWILTFSNSIHTSQILTWFSWLDSLKLPIMGWEIFQRLCLSSKITKTTYFQPIFLVGFESGTWRNAIRLISCHQWAILWALRILAWIVKVGLQAVRKVRSWWVVLIVFYIRWDIRSKKISLSTRSDGLVTIH